MTDDLGDRLAAAIDDAAVPVTAAEARLRGRRHVRRRVTVALCVTVVVIAAAGGAVARATTWSPSGRARVLVGGSSDASTSTTTSTVAEQAPLSSHLELPSGSMVAGSSETGYLVIENNTGAPVFAGGCGPNFAIALGSDQVHPSIASTLPSCVTPSMVPVGTSRWPVVLHAVNDSPCSLPGEPSDPPTRTCGLSGDPLLPGEYHTEYFGVADVHPPPVIVQVVASDKLASTTTTTGSG